MENELIDLFDSFETTKTDGLDSSKQARINQWKAKAGKSGDQKFRREARLREIKSNRQKGFENNRKINDQEEIDEKENNINKKRLRENVDEEIEDIYNSDFRRHSEESPKSKKHHTDFNEILMQSEWLIDVPEDLTNWYFTICPVGRRRLLNAQYGKTCLYNKGGYETKKTWSCLPGGQKCRGTCETNQTLLDGIQCDDTFYVLDLLIWSGYTYMDCEKEFRQYWIKQKMDEAQNSSKGGLKIKFLDCFLMSELKTVLEGNKTEKELTDGFLFYHKEAPYISGTTPLVGWLKPEHIDEQFKFIKLHSTYLEKPMEDLRKQYNPPTKLAKATIDDFFAEKNME